MLRHWLGLGGSIAQRRHVCRMSRSTAQSLSNGVETLAQINNTDIDTGGMADITNNRINIKRPGRYLLLAHWGLIGKIDGNATEFVFMRIRKNGGSTGAAGRSYGAYATGNVDQEVWVSTLEPGLIAGDYIDMTLYHNEGASQNTETAIDWRPTLIVSEL
jgi:hypothetical protein